MTYIRSCFRSTLILLAALSMFPLDASSDENNLPPFGRDTVLVWKTRNTGMESTFIVRIASFSPDRFLEWESQNNQGTVFMPSRDIQEAKDYVSRDLFEGGVDKRSKKNTTLWLSRRIYRELKSKGKAKCRLDGVGATFEFLGRGSLTVEVNGIPRELAVIKASDGRGAEFWFLDREENPQRDQKMGNQLTVLAPCVGGRHHWAHWADSFHWVAI